MTTALILVCEGVTIDTTPVTGQSLAISNILAGIPGWLNAITQTQKSFSA
jgi:hypothetical protein